ncbi:hypothetical protein T11_12075 [Trichinella zimbabwensis]|uniref:Uncharacterized protein n=1 Tax=Trichinella zimbabwensis TaxID=268475 RepID=A0A0V1GTL7_9BILA|nr:hypothetical protein T11_12075 [Trichinella zimbabwensis]
MAKDLRMKRVCLCRHAIACCVWVIVFAMAFSQTSTFPGKVISEFLNSSFFSNHYSNLIRCIHNISDSLHMNFYCLYYVRVSGSVVKRSLSSFKAFNMNNEDQNK